MYNFLFTTIAVIWYAIFDYEYTKEELLYEPSYYRIGITNACFNKTIVLRWYADAIWLSLMITFITVNTFEN